MVYYELLPKGQTIKTGSYEVALLPHVFAKQIFGSYEAGHNDLRKLQLHLLISRHFAATGSTQYEVRAVHLTIVCTYTLAVVPLVPQNIPWDII